MARFKFLNLGERVKVFINNVLAQINTPYDDIEPIRIEKNNNSHFGEPFDEINYQAFDDTDNGEIKSNIAKIIVNFPPDKSIVPASSNVEITMQNDEQINIMNFITYNAAVDRIKIIDFNDIGDLTFFSGFIFQNKEIMQYNFSQLKYKSNVSGIGFPYQEIKFQVGNANEYNPTIYSLKINIEGLASLVQIDEPDIVSNETSKSIIYNLKIKNGAVNKSAKISVETTLPEEVFTSEESKVSLQYRNSNIEITENGTFEFSTTLDQNGEDNLLLDIDLFLENNNIDGTIKFVLLEVDEEASLVGPIHEQTLTLTSI